MDRLANEVFTNIWNSYENDMTWNMKNIWLLGHGFESWAPTCGQPIWSHMTWTWKRWESVKSHHVYIHFYNFHRISTSWGLGVQRTFVEEVEECSYSDAAWRTRSATNFYGFQRTCVCTGWKTRSLHNMKIICQCDPDWIRMVPGTRKMRVFAKITNVYHIPAVLEVDGRGGGLQISTTDCRTNPSKSF